ncbi:cellulose synthase like G2, ARABIDOPSIS THALIANA CELLULOSE SYNTHASE LIKE G2 [Hibiscus trionum]|uniref:Cellulose synthase like G2, ARABIDOPSIS THALIANA CELLULOSE SYNTHASE LIKE G2 n=1 Tax=Hibiscus trionum TaxID=183268 RepID=A0A9W7H7I7_HIBTR|nr:cellulose synthase like G2, ARABIDOPSIS THALIANA CELLULOSE SYNTHASE LIKE G2 [Hibiscus trionum]
MEKSLPLHLLHANKFTIIINRAHAILHFIAILFLLHYRLSTSIPTLPWLLIFASELLMSLSWLISQSFRWRPVNRTVFPDRLPTDGELPTIDVFICTADPNKEPTVEVMNTVISAVAMDYPPEKLHVYVSDDAGSDATLRCTKEAWNFARCWVPFCRRYGIVTACPDIYFSSSEDDYREFKGFEFKAEREKMEQKYEVLKQRLRIIVQHRDVALNTNARDHPSIIEVINEYTETQEDEAKMPLLVYVSREKRPSHHHNFKAGALNVLLRISAVMSNSPYILVLDCDMYCNDPTSARQTMCYYCDPQTSSSIAFVQFPQTFRNIRENDIYDGQIRSTFKIYWPGIDGVGGPILSGTNYYIRREALLGNFRKEEDLMALKRSFGPSNDFIKTLAEDHKPNFIHDGESSRMLVEKAKVLASCSYENQTTWGSKVGFMYFCVLEDYFTGFTLHSKGWKSVYIDPKRPQFLGTSTTNFNDMSIQWTRWTSGLVSVAISRFCPLIYGLAKMSLVQLMCYSELAVDPLLHCLSLWGFALVPQLCLLNGIHLYPKVSDPNFNIFLIIFVSAISKSLYEIVVTTGGELRTWRNEMRIWMMKSVTCYTYGTLDAILNKLGMKEASFLPTNKVTYDEQVKLYEKGVFDFRAATMFVAPMVTVILVNIAAFVGGFVRVLVGDDGDGYWEKMAGQILLSFYILVSNYAVIEGMVLRRDKASIPLPVTFLSAVFSVFILLIGSYVLC